ncbi:MAG TPA: SUF system NifU family Fe-S cluster assembly protein [Burkholderiales bacterium]|jgi:nitrogen fixation NifU-like protein|nr:SUF system NifU family Fe-S cluster assembly protein [Burkholderiales bacterium]
MTEPKLYDDVLMDHIKNARNYCALDDANRTASGTNPLCGDEVTVYLRLDQDRVQKVAFQCTCCGISMASASIMTQSVIGSHAHDALASIRAFADLLATPADCVLAGGDANQYAVLDTVRRFPARIRCALLPWITLEAALQGREEATFAR